MSRGWIESQDSCHLKRFARADWGAHFLSSRHYSSDRWLALAGDEKLSRGGPQAVRKSDEPDGRGRDELFRREVGKFSIFSLCGVLRP